MVPHFSHIPIQNQYLLCWCPELNDLGSDRDIIEEAKAHMLVRLGMMARWPNDGERLLDFAVSYGKGGFDDTPRTQLSRVWRRGVDIKREVIVVRLRIRYVLRGESCQKRPRSVRFKESKIIYKFDLPCSARTFSHKDWLWTRSASSLRTRRIGSCFISARQPCCFRVSNMREMRSGCSQWPRGQLWVIILLEYTYPTWYALSRKVAGTDAARGRDGTDGTLKVGPVEALETPSTSIPSFVESPLGSDMVWPQADEDLRKDKDSRMAHQHNVVTPMHLAKRTTCLHRSIDRSHRFT